MREKVILISIDGMRPDALAACRNSFAAELMQNSSYTLKGKTVFPPVTLPCHMSLFHSVTPERHGVTTNYYTPPARPVEGLFEVMKKNGRRCAMYYGWEPLRDVSRPGSLLYSEFIECYSAEHTDALLTDRAIARIRSDAPDLVFLYMVETDDKGGHDHGWMTPEYLSRVSAALDNAARVMRECPDYTVVITADHGGHGRGHGIDCPEDMTVPIFFCGAGFEKAKDLGEISILDIAPTVCDLAGVKIPDSFEGKSLCGKRRSRGKK